MWIPYSRQVAADVANPDRKEAVGQANVLFCIRGKDGTVDLYEYEAVEDRFFEITPEIKPTHFLIIPEIPSLPALSESFSHAHDSSASSDD